ncbi:DUF4112 domain-containing protein [Botrimarina mediterranea]|uniref:DUF4112 domain-containing protein n=1 Tax=Botrimarina mediterranea TaxID=2528022 RepID=A0A518KCT5_9BACT|nr:DUF4112 domain-containing protein [Botrimarina mediterranea]QDV75613.1 hypothetical protein Spa11_38330 [Botrimarina mediterranea]
MEAAKRTLFGRRAARSRDAAVEDARKLATLLDDAFRIPGTNIRFGWDAIVGLLYGPGDVATFIVGLSPVIAAWRLGASRWLLFRMLMNLGLDSIIGIIPGIGTLFDIFYKANRRNARLLDRHVAAAKRAAAEAPQTGG